MFLVPRRRFCSQGNLCNDDGIYISSHCRSKGMDHCAMMVTDFPSKFLMAIAVGKHLSEIAQAHLENETPQVSPIYHHHESWLYKRKNPIVYILLLYYQFTIKGLSKNDCSAMLTQYAILALSCLYIDYFDSMASSMSFPSHGSDS